MQTFTVTPKPSQAPSPRLCPQCGTKKVYHEPKGMHVGAYCSGCGRWLAWVSQGRPVELMPFGKFKYKKIKDLPGDYLAWLLENATGIKGSLRLTLQGEYDRRVRQYHG